jgi:predicted secreted protein
MTILANALRSFHERHEKIKHTVHTAWRIPLPKYGQIIMGCVYFTIPVVGGWYVMQWAISKSVDSIGPRGEKLRIKQLSLMDMR